MAKDSKCELSQALLTLVEALMKPFEAVLRPGLKPEDEDTHRIFERFEASRTWGSILIEKWSQLITAAVLNKNFNPGTLRLLVLKASSFSASPDALSAYFCGRAI